MSLFALKTAFPGNLGYVVPPGQVILIDEFGDYLTDDDGLLLTVDE